MDAERRLDAAPSIAVDAFGQRLDAAARRQEGTTGSVFRFTTRGAEIKAWLDAPCQSDSKTRLIVAI